MKIKTFPHIRPHGKIDCGVACLMMIFKCYHYYNTQHVFNRMAEVITDRSNLFALANIAQAFGFTAKPYDLNFSSLAKIGMPCIAQCKGNHFVVVYEVSEENIWIADPIHGKAKLYKGEFIRNWNGIVLSVTPNPEIISPKDLNEPELFYFKEHKSLLARIYAPLLSFLKR